MIFAALPVSSAQAYRFEGDSWPQRTITLYGEEGVSSRVVVRAARAWNRARVGLRFERASRERADVIIQPGVDQCGGSAPVGYLYGERSRVQIGVGCGEGLAILSLTHELGHVMGLGHERRRCALMNPYADQSGTPNRCGLHSLRFWLKKPLRRDDIRGARALYG